MVAHFDPDPAGLDGVSGVDGDLIVGQIAVLDGKVEIKQRQIEIGKDQLLLDHLPDDPRHLIPVEVGDRVLHLDLVHVEFSGAGRGEACETIRFQAVPSPIASNRLSIASCFNGESKSRERETDACLDGGNAARTEGIDAEAAVASPAIILVKPQLGENIGFAARAMANFGLNDLRLVAPRDGWPNDKARAAAAGAAFVVDQATVYDSVESAIAELNFVLASTARPREMVKAVLSPESAATELRERGAKAERTGVLFGPERSGLDNDTIALADAILTAPVSPDFASLSLPQAVLLFGYEWLKVESADPPLGRVTAFDGPAVEGIAYTDTQASDASASCSACSTISKANWTRPAFFIRPRSVPPWFAPSATCSTAWRRPSKTCEPGAGSWQRCRARVGPAKKSVIVPPRFSYCDCP